MREGSFTTVGDGSKVTEYFGIYLPAPPTLSTLSPVSGTAGSTLAATGTALTGATAVTFTSSGGMATAVPTSYVVASTTSITGIVVPTGLAPGAYTATVTTAGGVSNGLTYTVVPPAPTLTAVAPNPGGLGQAITLTGTDQGSPTALSAAVRLPWATASEKNSHSFEVERSTDGVAFANIGTVAAAGTTAATHSYGLLDAALPTGASVLYYRLRQVDLDGTFSYSPVRVVALGAGGVALFPNPARGGVATLTGVAASQAVQVFDAVGRAVAIVTADASGTATLALPAGLSGGVYVMRAGQHALRLTVE